MNDLAFVLNGPAVARLHALATLAHNEWLAESGDFTGLKTLRLFIVYRALVRSLVEMPKQHPIDARRYLRVATRTACEPSPYLLLCHGFSASGKSLASQSFAPLTGAVRISSDVQRKRTRPLCAPNTAKLATDAYTPAAIRRAMCWNSAYP
ncbi:AAA family ATPase [Caballeronia grimmiae]|uniref:AAA family ATPase n=1 Tax=Caballeronia grimmiae TaxID=1071679 RepID=UPI0038BCAAD6